MEIWPVGECSSHEYKMSSQTETYRSDETHDPCRYHRISTNTPMSFSLSYDLLRPVEAVVLRVVYSSTAITVQTHRLVKSPAGKSLFTGSLSNLFTSCTTLSILNRDVNQRGTHDYPSLAD